MSKRFPLAQVSPSAIYIAKLVYATARALLIIFRLLGTALPQGSSPLQFDFATLRSMEVDPWELLILRLAHEINDSALVKLAIELSAPTKEAKSSEALLKWLVSEVQGQQQAAHPTHWRSKTIQRLRSAFTVADVSLSHLIGELDAFSAQYPALVHSSSVNPSGVVSTLSSETPGVLSHAKGVLIPTVREKNLFDFLLEVNKLFNLGCTLRVSGGWVRDKARF